MKAYVATPPLFFAQHKASGEVRRVCAIRHKVNGAMVFQFSQVIKHNGETLYWALSSECRCRL